MITSMLERKLLDDRRVWQNAADRAVELATVDAQSNYALRKAREKLAAIERALRRIASGSLGRCDECGGTIEPERLEALVDSDCHTCAACAQAAALTRKTPPSPRHLQPAFRARAS